MIGDAWWRRTMMIMVRWDGVKRGLMVMTIRWRWWIWGGGAVGLVKAAWLLCVEMRDWRWGGNWRRDGDDDDRDWRFKKKKKNVIMVLAEEDDDLRKKHAWVYMVAVGLVCEGAWGGFLELAVWLPCFMISCFLILLLPQDF